MFQGLKELLRREYRVTEMAITSKCKLAYSAVRVHYFFYRSSDAIFMEDNL